MRMSKIPHCTFEKARQRYVFQIRVPIDLKEFFSDRTHIKVALGRIDEVSANTKAEQLREHWTNKFAATRRAHTQHPRGCTHKVSLTLDESLFQQAVSTRRIITLDRLWQALCALRQADDDAWQGALVKAQDWLKVARRRLARGAADDAQCALEEIAEQYGVVLKQEGCNFETFTNLINADAVAVAGAWVATLSGEASLDALRPMASQLLPLTRFYGTPADSLVSAWQDRLKLIGKNARPKTRAKYSSIITDFASVLGETPVEALTDDHVTVLMQLWQERGNGSRTLVAKLRTVITLLTPIATEAAARCRAMLPHTRIEKARRLPLTAEQLRDLRHAVVADEATTDDDTMLVDLMTLTGARLGELMQTRIADVTRHDGLWHIRIGGHEDAVLKTIMSRRTVPVSTAHAPELEQWLTHRVTAAEPSDSLFQEAHPDKHGCFGGAESKRLNRVIRTVHADKRIVLESIRNTVARTMRAEGVDPRVRRAMLGHADADVHEMHYDPEALMTVEDFMQVVPVLEALAARARGTRPAAS